MEVFAVYSGPARVGLMVAVTVGMSLLAGCGDDEPPKPTAAQAEAMLKADIDWLVKLIHVKDVRVAVEGGRDIPCGEGKEKRSYAVAGADTSSIDGPVNTFNMLTGGLGRRGYMVVSVDWKTPGNELVKGESRVRITVDSSRKQHFELSGEARCLNRG
ncbi:hypothetical protein GCM10010517_42650 [Streptosporangium fragile]|uniref:Lipoprotein n=1 Tax=Streptosporangium fragile TaxID=46186 RepID=A0ABN3W0M8_9ACTN